MDLNQDVLLPILFAIIVANIAIVGLLFAANRIGRHRSAATAGGTAAIERTLSTSYVDRSARGTWPDAVDAEADGAAQAPGDPTGAPDEAGDAGDPGADTTPIALVPAIGGADEARPDADTSVPLAEAVASIDDLTGLPDAASFARLIGLEDARVQRYHRPATVVVFDLDGLDRLTALLGPAAGERVLPAVADTIRRLARDADTVARLADGRFGVLLPETDEVAAINYIERVRRACELWLDSGAIALQLAIGWAGTTGDPALHEALRMATERMYVERRRHERRSDPAAPAGGRSNVASRGGAEDDTRHLAS